jgi:uncharacterized protein YlxW (UPF0749 family)
MTDSPDSRRPTDSVQLLVALVNDHLDPGYAAAAARKGAAHRPRWYDDAAVVTGCALVGFVLVVAYIATHRGAPEAARVHGSLVERVRTAQQTANDLNAQVTELQQKLDRAQARALSGSGQLAQDLELARLQAGLTAVTGPGVAVTLSEPPAPTGSATPGGSNPSGQASNILTDRDVRSVVNELWHDGAEAIAVNDVRLTPTSSIRLAGEAVLVDTQAVIAPFEITAIGNADLLATNFAQSTVASRYQTLSGVEGIGFSFTDTDHLSLPANTAPRILYATVASPHRHGHR